MSNPFDAALSLLEGAAFAIRGHAKDRQKALKDCREIANACIVLEAAGKLNAGDIAWFDWMMDTTIAEYAPRVEGMMCPGRGRKDRFRALLSALPDKEPT